MVLSPVNPPLPRACVAVSCVFLWGLLSAVLHAQQIPGRRLDDITIVAEFHDGYWEWYHQYLVARDEACRRISEIRLELAVLAAERKKLRAEWLRYRYLENQLTPQSAYDQGWMAYLGELAGESRSQVDDFAFRWSAGLWGVPLAPEEADAALEQTYQAKRDGLRALIEDRKRRQSELIDDAWAVHRGLEQLCHEQRQKSGERRPWLNAEKQRLEDELTILEIQLYDAAQWYLPDELPALIERLDLEHTATEEVALFLRAKVALARAAWNDEKNWLQLTSPRKAPPDPRWVMAARAPRLEAIANLRRVLELNPQHAEARGMLMEQELYWLREIAAKVDVESRASVQAFRAYLTARGFYADQPQGWSQHTYEVISALWGLGPIALAAGLPGLNVADARATELGVTQAAAARNQVSLLAIMRLVKNGVLLTEIPGLTIDQVAERMTMHTAGGQPLSREKASQVVVDIQATLRELDDLRLLASADPEYLVEDVNRAYGKTYYAPLDPTYTWYESFGDLLNVHNIALLWGPGAIAKVDGKWAGIRHISATESLQLEAAGRLVTGRQLFLNVTRLDRLGETIASTSLGSRFVAQLAADRALLTRQGTFMSLTNMGARLSSALMLYAGATYLGTQAGIPGMGLLVEIIGEIGPVTMLSDIARHAQVPLDKLGTHLDELGEFLIRQQDELAASRRYLDEVSELGERLSDDAIGATERAAIHRRLDDIVEEIEERSSARPPGSLAEPVDDAAKSASASYRSGDNLEAQAAITGGIKTGNEAREQVSRATGKLGKAKAALAGSSAAPPPRIAGPDELKSIDRLIDEGSPDMFWQSRLYSDTGPGRSLQAGDEAVRRRDLEAAAQHYRAAREAAYASDNPNGFMPEIKLARARLELVVNAQRARRQLDALQDALPPLPAVKDITPEKAAEMLTQLEDEVARGVAKRVGGANNVFRVIDPDDGHAYYIKRLDPDRVRESVKLANPRMSPDELEEAVQREIDQLLASEAAGSALAQRLGLPTPTSRYIPEQHALVSRAIRDEGDELTQLWDYPEYVAVALKREYAQQRAFRAWLGDSDGHFGNLILGDDGRLYMIDFDLATMSGTNSRHLGAEFRSEEDLVRGVVEAHVQIPARNAGSPPEAIAMDKYRWMGRLDQTVTYDDMAPTVEAIKGLVKAGPPEDPTRVLRQMLEAAGHPDVDGAVRSLTERAEKLDQVLRAAFDERLLKLGVAWWRSPRGPLLEHPQWQPWLQATPVGEMLLAATGPMSQCFGRAA